MKPIRLSKHALEQCAERGTTPEEVRLAVQKGAFEPTKHGRVLHRFNFPFDRLWQGKAYAVKQVAPVVKEESNELVVITVFTYYF